ncbi:hypothetical protein ACAG39_08980 [Caldicellulosiruptoraceae bacterium PP1]
MPNNHKFFFNYQDILTIIFFINIFIFLTNKNTYTLIVLIVSFMLFIISIIYNLRQNKRINFEDINLEWGKPSSKKIKDISKIKSFFDIFLKDTNDFVVDDLTWMSLDMDKIFEKINKTQSFYGSQLLYYLLRTPKLEEKEIYKRNNIIEKLRNDKNLTIMIQYYIKLYNSQGNSILFDFLWKNSYFYKQKNYYVYVFLSTSVIVFTILTLINTQKWIIFLVINIIINGFLYTKSKQLIESYINIISQINNLIFCAKKLSNLNVNSIFNEYFDLNNTIESLNGFEKYTKKLLVNNNIYRISMINDALVIFEIIKLILLREIILFHRCWTKIITFIEQIKKLYIEIAIIDSFCAIASFKDSLNYFCTPKFLFENNIYINCSQLYHPLLKNPVPYSFELNKKGFLITGSNASGKSTFIKAVGINALFSQVFGFSLAKEYSANIFKIFSVINLSDDIMNNESFFFRESKAIKNIINNLDNNKKVLCLLDEVFKGTNSHDRINTAKSLLKYLFTKNVCCIVSTHDYELTILLNNYFENYYFDEEIIDDKIKYNYKLKKGVASRSTVFHILKLLDYPEEIISELDINS